LQRVARGATEVFKDLSRSEIHLANGNNFMRTSRAA
jgi:hypothetical protein